MAEVDLTALARGYHHRPPSPASLDRARQSGELLRVPAIILDAGGGPGHHAAVWASQGHVPIVLDPGEEMVRQASERGIAVVQAVAQAMPIRDGRFDLVWFHLSIHYGDWQRAADEALRVARPGGRIEIWTLAADHHDRSMLARWFPSVTAIDDARFPDGAEVEDYLATHAADVTRSHVVEERIRTAGEWEEAVRAGFVSTLQFIDEAELRSGLARFRRAHPEASERIVYELRFDRIVVSV